MQVLWKQSQVDKVYQVFVAHHRRDATYSLEDAKKWSKLIAQGHRPWIGTKTYEGKLTKGLWLHENLLCEEGSIPIHWNHFNRVRSFFQKACEAIDA